MNIEIPGDELVPDAELAERWGVTPRTLHRYDKLPDGLPLVIHGGKKWRPLKACSEWMARRIKKPNPSRKSGYGGAHVAA